MDGSRVASTLPLATRFAMSDRAASGTPARYSVNGALPAKNSSPNEDLVYPALHLYPLNDTFVPKQINLAPANSRNRVKIGRYSNSKSVPNPLNGYFDSKVLSRAHAEVWSEGGHVYIKDVKSSNGTFVNGTRLSPESQESEPLELHSDDVVDFGIDILTDDNKEVLHHRVACRVFLVITAEDALKLRNDFTSMYRGGVPGGPLGGAGVCPGAEGGLRRGKHGFNFDHVIFRLQSELQKSREVGSELKTLSTAVQDIQGTLVGSLPPTKTPGYQDMVPPKGGSDAPSVDKMTVTALEEQLANTQSLMSEHVERIKGLESTFAEMRSLKDQINVLHEQLQDARRTIDTRQWQNVRVIDDDSSVASADTEVPEPRESKSPKSPSRMTVLERISALERSNELESLLQRIAALESEVADLRSLPQTIHSSLTGWRTDFERRWDKERQLAARRRPNLGLWLLTFALTGAVSAQLIRWLWVA